MQDEQGLAEAWRLALLQEEVTKVGWVTGYETQTKSGKMGVGR